MGAVTSTLSVTDGHGGLGGAGSVRAVGIGPSALIGAQGWDGSTGDEIECP